MCIILHNTLISNHLPPPYSHILGESLLENLLVS